jgi:predicted MFS family arabinose efflux permease
VLVALLLSTGIGSLLTARTGAEAARRVASRRALLLVVAVVLAAMTLGPLLRVAVSLPFAVRLIVTLLLLTPLGLLMGSQAPLGIRLVEARAPELIPWCWGLNGVASVVATATGTLLALHGGFSALLLAGGLVYLIAAAVVPDAPKESASAEGTSIPPAEPHTSGSA